MKWSKYNVLYESEKHGLLLFNTLSGIFLDLNDDEMQNTILSLKDNDNIDHELKDNEELKNYLLSSAIINESGDIPNIELLKMRSLMNRYNKTRTKLVLVPTMDCNLRCSYCFIGNNIKPIRMSGKVIEQLKKYIQTHYTNQEILRVSWFGGEPLLAMPEIRQITEYILSLGVNLQADIVTNGVLLTQEVVDSLEALHVVEVQVTLDGLKVTHDKKRIFENGNGTFDIIMHNLELLHKHAVEKNYFSVNLRINIDKSNEDEYHQLHKIIKKKYPRFAIYPGILMQYRSCSSAINCFSNQKEVAQFWMKQYEKHGIDDMQFYPLLKGTGACIAENPYSTIIGPEGEQYLCLKDVGDKNEVYGNIFNQVQNISLVTHYTVRNFCYDNEHCVKCHAVALCGGGCPNLKYRKAKYNENHDYCAQFKNLNVMKKYLDIHYEIRKKYDKEL